MKLDHVTKGEGASGSVVRLYDFDSLQARKFRKAIQQNVLDNDLQLEMTRLEFVKPNKCALIFRLSKEDKGITTTDSRNFFCDLTRTSYSHLAELLDPFCDDDFNGPQWLYDIDAPIELLFSQDGKW
jgi:hypothetical protein